MLGLMSLPTKEQFEALKQEVEKKRILEKQVSGAQGRWFLASSCGSPEHVGRRKRQGFLQGCKSEPLTLVSLFLLFCSGLALIYRTQNCLVFSASPSFLSEVYWFSAVQDSTETGSSLSLAQIAEDPDARESFIECFGICIIKQKIICVFNTV